MIEQEPLTSAPQVVLDTNTVLDLALFGDGPAAPLGKAIVQGQLQWITSAPMLTELGHVLTRPRMGRWSPSGGAAQVNAFVAAHARCLHAPKATIPPAPVCRDASDQMFIDLAWANRATWLISRDKALLVLARRCAVRGLQIATPAQWARGWGTARTPV